MKPHIFIAIHYMHLGGAEISLIGLLQALDPEKVDIDLFVYSHEGELMKLIPEYVNLLPEIKSYSMLEKPIKDVIKRGYWGTAFARLAAKLKGHRKYKKSGSNLIYDYVECYAANNALPFLPAINKDTTYDLAISFLTPHQYVRNRVKAKKYACWIHTDYTKHALDVEAELKVWRLYDYVISISTDVTKTFLQVFPALAPKIYEIENILSSDFVRHKAEEFHVDWNHEMTISPACDGLSVARVRLKTLIIISIGRFSEQKNFDNLPFICSKLIEEMSNLLSIGRFCEAKNYDNVPNICKRICDYGYDIKWFIIGFGPDENLIRQKIAEAGMQEHVIILGKKENPYPYIKACDIYVQPSRYEGKSVTVREAQMLCKPVAVTNYPTASSQIQDGIDGVIVPMDNEGCAKGLAEFILNIEKQNRIVEYLKTHDYGNVGEVEKIYTLLEK